MTCQGPRGRGSQVRIGAEPWATDRLTNRVVRVLGTASDAMLRRDGRLGMPELRGTDASDAWGGFYGPNYGAAGDYFVIYRDVDHADPTELLDQHANDVGAVWGDSLTSCW